MSDGDEAVCLYDPASISSDSDSSQEDSGSDSEFTQDDFKEFDEVMHSIIQLAFQCGQQFGTEGEWERDLECSYDTMKRIFDQYQEQPHLLDPYLEDLITHILLIVHDEEPPMIVKHQAFKYLYLILKVRGFKEIVRHLPHEVHDFEAVLRFLEEQEPSDARFWETRYCLLIWLSIIIMLPFNMQVLDSGLQENSVTNRLFSVCKVYLTGYDLCRDAAAIVLARFVTRDDVKIVHLQPFLDWLFEIVLENVAEGKEWQRFGPMACLAAILKHGKREDLLPLAPDLLRSVILKLKPIDHTYPLSAKAYFKIISRLGLVFLKPRVTSWSYNRGARTLADNLSQSYQRVAEEVILDTGIGAGDTGVSANQEQHPQAAEQGEGDAGLDDPDNEVGEELEEIIEELIEGLKNNNYIARWSAAKGIGRIVGRLSQSDGDDVISHVIGLFDMQYSDVSWQGACLGIAELANRNLLLPERLPEVMPLLMRALVFERLHGFTSVGDIVRDAACYVVWGLARAYQPSVIEPYIQELATTLICVACFDREVNCRRAAAAAFQECVGRLGNVPHGIQINLALDYFNVRLRTKTYLTISPKLAAYQEYTLGLIDHLLYQKINNWDPDVRKIAAKALNKLTSCAPDYAAKHCLQILLHRINELDAYEKHGTILATGEIIYALSVLGKLNLIENRSLVAVKDLLSFMKDELKLQPSLNSPTHALLKMIENCAKASLPFHKEEVIIEWQGIVDKCLDNVAAEVRNDAALALQQLCITYYGEDSADGQLLRTEIIQRYLAGLNVGVLNTRIGYSLALGALPKFMLGGHLSEVIHALEKCTAITQETRLWAQARKAAVTALSNLCICIGLEKRGAISCYDYFQDILDVFLQCMRDYTVDNRGDIGAWVREEAMLKIRDILLMAVDEAPELLLPNTVTRVFTSIAQQAVERIDRSRAIAGRAFSSLVMKQDNPVPHIPAEDKVRTIFTRKVCLETNWTTDNAISLFIRLQTEPPFSYTILLGLTSTIGSLIEPLSGRTSLLLYSHYLDQPESTLERLSNDILRIFESNLHNDRVIVPFLYLLDQMLTWNGLLEVLRNPDSSFATRLLEFCKKEISNSANTRKLNSGLDLFCQLIQVPGEVSRRSWVQLCIMLLHRFLWLRRRTASKLVDTLTTYGKDMKLAPEVTEEVIRILEDTEWADPDKDMLRAKRKTICALLNIPAPVVAGGRAQ